MAFSCPVGWGADPSYLLHPLDLLPLGAFAVQVVSTLFDVGPFEQLRSPRLHRPYAHEKLCPFSRVLHGSDLGSVIDFLATAVYPRQKSDFFVSISTTGQSREVYSLH